MAVLYIVAVSIVLQITAAFLALRLIRVTGKAVAWSFVTAAVLLMAVHNAVVLGGLLSDYESGGGHLRHETVPAAIKLAISALLVVGIYRIAPLFESIKRSGEALRESEQSYRMMAENLPGIVYRVFIEEGNRMKFFNDMLLPMTGYAPEELSCGSVCSIEHFIYHEDKGRVLKEVEKAIEEDRPFQVEYRLRHRDGGIRHFLERARPIRGSDGKPLFIDGVIIDVSAEKEAEFFIKNILEAVDEGFIVIDRNYRIVSANRAFCSQVKISPEGIRGRHCYEVSHGRNRPCFEEGEECAVKATFHSGGPHVVLHRHTDASGSPVLVEVKSYPLKDPSGNVLSAIEITNDITEKKKLEEELLQAQKMEAVGQLAGGIAHDFNNILMGIIGFAKILETGIDKKDPLRAYAAQIISSSERAAGLTQSLLAFSRKQIVNLRPVELNMTIKNLEKLLGRVMGEDITLRTWLYDEPLTVMADPVHIEQMLMNLSTNSRDAMPEGGDITISTSISNPDAEFINSHGRGTPAPYAVITFTDTGEGMDEKTKERIFEPFFTTKDIGKGTGLGLSIVYGTVKQHSGFIEVQSERGKGAAFSIYLPLLNSLKEGLPRGGHEDIPRGAEGLLVAEDDKDVRGLLKKILEAYGYKVFEAEDGKEAVEVFQRHGKSIELLILDVVMPRLNGKEALDEIRKTTPGIKALFLSGYTDDIIREKHMTTGGLEFIQKPVAPEEILLSVRRILDAPA